METMWFLKEPRNCFVRSSQLCTFFSFRVVELAPAQNMCCAIGMFCFSFCSCQLPVVRCGGKMCTCEKRPVSNCVIPPHTFCWTVRIIYSAFFIRYSSFAVHHIFLLFTEKASFAVQCEFHQGFMCYRLIRLFLVANIHPSSCCCFAENDSVWRAQKRIYSNIQNHFWFEEGVLDICRVINARRKCFRKALGRNVDHRFYDEQLSCVGIPHLKNTTRWLIEKKLCLFETNCWIPSLMSRSIYVNVNYVQKFLCRWDN